MEMVKHPTWGLAKSMRASSKGTAVLEVQPLGTTRKRETNMATSFKRNQLSS